MVSNTDLRSKLTDGVLAGGVLIMLELMFILFITPIKEVFGNPGLLVYTVSLLAVTVICLERCLTIRNPDMIRAWWGVLGGMTAWVVIELNNWLGNQSITNETGLLNLFLALLMVSVLWRRIAPLGLRYYFLLAFMGWIGHVALAALSFLTRTMVQLQMLVPLIGYLAGAVIVVGVFYIFLRSQTRLERLNAAIVIWLSAMIMIYIFRGGFI